MDTRIATSDINTTKVVKTLMARHGLPTVGEDVLKLISKLEGIEFKKALAAIANGEDSSNESRNYICSVCSLVTGPSLSKLTALGHGEIALATFIAIGKVCGQEFREKMRKASSGDENSIYWINKKLGKVATEAITQKSTDNQEYSQVEPAAEEFQSQDKKYKSVHYFGNNAAMCFNAIQKGELYTLMLDAGDRTTTGNTKKVDWKSAIHFQFTEQELVSMLAVLLGEQEAVDFKGHGPANDKSFSLKTQQNKFYMSCSAKGVAMKGVPVPKLSAFGLTALIIRQLELNHPSLANGGVVELTRNLSKELVSA